MNRNDRPIQSNRTSSCQRCATCCRKGGPALHLEDAQLVESGQIPAAQLYTIRKGEWVRDNVKNVLCRVPADIIKIKGLKNQWTCAFLDTGNLSCTIYDRRPLECRMLQCWNTKPLEDIYGRNRLTRQDLFFKAKGLWDLIADHQQKCDYDQIKPLADEIHDHTSKTALEQLDYILRYDANIRRLASEKGQVDSGFLDLLFGRPVAATLKMFGLKAVYTQGIYRITTAKLKSLGDK